MDDRFDLAAYLDRVSYTAPVRADLHTLRGLHRAHLDAIPFENLAIQMGGRVDLDAASLQASLVRRRRGGYCFQQNSLFRLALTAICFTPRPCEARVRQGAAGAIRPRTHMVLVVPVAGRDWLADVGFGGDGIAEPLALDGSRSEQDGWTYRLAADGRLHILQREAEARRWEDLYAFTTDAVHPIDYVVANWFTSTYPESGFLRTLTAQRVTRGERHILRNLTYTVVRGQRTETREIGRADLVPLLREVFGLDVPEDARFLALDGS
jgi:N-hydroxyarylamine O-acetyltransferase